MHKLIFEFLKNPNHKGIRAKLLAQPGRTFNQITTYRGPYPAGLDPRDFSLVVGPILSNIADKVPNLFIKKMQRGYWAARYMIIASAAASKSTKFVPIILDLLNDRSIYIKSLILDLMYHWPHLRQPHVIPVIEKLLQGKVLTKSKQDIKMAEQVLHLIKKENC